MLSCADRCKAGLRLSSKAAGSTPLSRLSSFRPLLVWTTYPRVAFRLLSRVCLVLFRFRKVCDHTCGTGRFDNYNCNWRGHGATCRYCFNDVQQVLLLLLLLQALAGGFVRFHIDNVLVQSSLSSVLVVSAGARGCGSFRCCPPDKYSLRFSSPKK